MLAAYLHGVGEKGGVLLSPQRQRRPNPAIRLGEAMMNAVKSRGGGGNLRGEGTPASLFVATVGVGWGYVTWNFRVGLKPTVTTGPQPLNTAEYYTVWSLFGELLLR